MNLLTYFLSVFFFFPSEEIFSHEKIIFLIYKKDKNNIIIFLIYKEDKNDIIIFHIL